MMPSDHLDQILRILIQNGKHVAENKLFHLQDEVDKQLEKLLSKKTGLDGKIRDIAKAIPNLDIVNSDAKQLAEMVAITSKLAENVSAKVRQLDIARVRTAFLF